MSKRVEKDTCPADIINRNIEREQFIHALVNLGIKILCFVIALLLIFTVFFGISIQSGEGMYPRVRDGDVILWYRLSGEYSVGDVVVVDKDNESYTCRIVAVAGDKVEASKEGKLIVNGAIQFEEIHYDTFMENSKYDYPYKVPEKSYFLLGDMRTGAKDSRDFGAVSNDEIKGKVITVLRHRGI